MRKKFVKSCWLSCAAFAALFAALMTLVGKMDLVEWQKLVLVIILNFALVAKTFATCMMDVDVSTQLADKEELKRQRPIVIKIDESVSGEHFLKIIEALGTEEEDTE